MGFNMHGLAFKQSMMTLVGFSIVFATLFGVLSFKVRRCSRKKAKRSVLQMSP